MKMIAAVLLCMCSVVGWAQKEDYVWLAGYGIQKYSNTFQKWVGQSRLDFNHNPITINLDSLGISFGRSNSMVCNENGSLLLSCNGIKVHNRFDEKIPGSDTLGNVDGLGYYYLDTYAFELGMSVNQTHITLPNSNLNGAYEIFHTLIDTFEVANGIESNGTRLLQTTININENFGHGAVVQKDAIILSDENNATVTAVRHGNGRDWWICTNRTFNNCYNVTYFDGINTLTNTYCGGGASARAEFLPTRFSQDGTKFASAAKSGLNIFDFDRCTGNLILQEHVSIPELIDSMYWWTNVIEFSPKNRFLYLFTTYRIFQFDMWANPIAASRKTIAAFDPDFGCPFPHTFRNAQLAPDGKIYISSGNTNYCLSVINNPDGEGELCGFVRYGVDLPNFISGLPHFPNYRLGALPGSACDTLTSVKDIAEKEKILKVFPNPASDVATIDYGYTDWSKGEATMEIANSLGQMVHSQSLPMYSGFQKLQVGNYASGSYTVFIKRKNVVVATGRLVRE